MPRKSKATSPELDTPEKNVTQGRFWLPNEARWGGFINIRLSDEQKEDFHAWYEASSVLVSGYLDDHLADGIKFGASNDRENECVVVTYTGALVAQSNERYCCTSRAGNMSLAVGLAVWKHEVLAQGDYGNFSPRTGDFLRFG